MPRYYQPKRIDMTGFVSGDLTVIRCAGYNSSGVAVWECLCKCGNSVQLPRRNLVHKQFPTKSCGCLRSKTSRRLMTAINSRRANKHEQEQGDEPAESR